MSAQRREPRQPASADPAIRPSIRPASSTSRRELPRPRVGQARYPARLRRRRAHRPAARRPLGCEVGAIANSLIFDADGSPVLDPHLRRPPRRHRQGRRDDRRQRAGPRGAGLRPRPHRPGHRWGRPARAPGADPDLPRHGPAPPSRSSGQPPATPTRCSTRRTTNSPTSPAPPRSTSSKNRVHEHRVAQCTESAC